MVYGLIGEKLGHSYSKVIHESLGKYEYGLFSLDKTQFETFVAERQFDGLNITIPYKKAVIPFCDHITDLADRIGAVNTLYFKDGSLWGTNTDYRGFLYAAEAAGISFKDKKVLILGNGGTSLMARTAVSDSGASQILVTSRRGEPGCIAYQELSDHKDIEIIVNTTPVGTYPGNGQCLIDLSQFPCCCGVLDVIYNPFKTALLQQAQELGITYTNGLPMLIAQATAAAEYFLGKGDFQKQNASIIGRLQKEIENIVIIGGTAEHAEGIAQTLDKLYSPLTNISQSSELGKGKGLLIHIPEGMACSPEDVKHLTQNGRILEEKRK